MRRFLAYSIMMLTVVGTLVFNTQTVLESTTDAMEYGKSTQLTFSLSSRDQADYDVGSYPDLNSYLASNDLTTIDIKSKIMDRLDAIGVRNANVEIVNGITSGSQKGEGYKVNVTFSPLSDTELSNVKQILSYDGSLSIATVGDDTVKYQDHGDFFDDTAAKIVYSGTTAYPAICIEDTTEMDELITAAKNASDAHKNDKKTEETKSANRKYADDTSVDSSDSEEDTSNETKLFLWQNKTKDDTYNKAYGYNGEEVDDDVLAKVVCTLDTSNYSSDNKIITITSDKDGNAFTVSTARTMVAMLNSEDYGFDIHYLYSNTIYAGFGSSALKNTYLAFGICLAAIVILLICFYGYSGITASINLLATVFMSLILFNLLGFEFSIAGILGIVVAACLSIFLSCNYFEHIKNELKKGRDIEKANKEGYRKSFLIGLDTSIVLFVTSLFSFLLALGSYKTFFGAVLVGTIFAWVITTFLNKWATYWLCKDVKENNKPYFSFKKPTKENKKVTFVKPSKKGRMPLYISVIVAVLALGIGLPLNYATKSGDASFFNNSGSYTDSYQLTIAFGTYNKSYTQLESSDAYIEYIKKIGENSDDKFDFVTKDEASKLTTTNYVTYDASSAFVNTVEDKDDDNIKYYITYFSVHTYQNLNDVKTSNENKTILESIKDGMEGSSSMTIVLDDNTLVNPLNDGNYKSSSYSIYSLTTSPLNLKHDVLNLFLIVFLIAAFASIYAFLRYGLNTFLSVITSGTVFACLSVGVLSLSQLGFTPYIALILFAFNLIFDFMVIPTLSENKATIKEKGLKGKALEEERADILNELTSKNILILVSTFVSGLVFSIPFVFIDSSLLSTTIFGIILAILGFALIITFVLPFHLLCSSHINFKRFNDWFMSRKTSKKEEKDKVAEDKIAEANKANNPNEFAPDGTRYVDTEGPHETIIIGMNEFRHH